MSYLQQLIGKSEVRFWTHLAMCSDGHSFVGFNWICVLPVVGQLIWKSLRQPGQRRNDAPLSAALVSASRTVRHCSTERNTSSAALFKRVGENGWSQNDSAEWECALIKATNLQTGTSKRPRRFSWLSPRAFLTAKKDLRRLSCTPCCVLSL